MRTSNLILSLCVATALSGPVFAQTAEKYQSLSRQLVAQAHVAMKAEKPDDARLLFERALVADPANVEAMTGIGHSYEASGRVGASLRYYRLALEIEPNHKEALKSQALAFLKRDMASRAEENRQKLARLCLQGCEALSKVVTAIDAYQATRTDTAENKEG